MISECPLGLITVEVFFILVVYFYFPSPAVLSRLIRFSWLWYLKTQLPTDDMLSAQRCTLHLEFINIKTRILPIKFLVPLSESLRLLILELTWVFKTRIFLEKKIKKPKKGGGKLKKKCPLPTSFSMSMNYFRDTMTDYILFFLIVVII